MSKRIGILGVAAWIVATCMFTSMGMAADGDAKAKRGAKREAKQGERAKRGDAARPGGQQRPGGQRGGSQGGSALAAITKLDLSAEQQKKIRAIQEEIREQQQKWAEENKDKMAELREEFAKARESGGGREAFAAVMKKREEIMKDRPDNTDSIKEILAILTKDQKDELLIALLTAQGGQRGSQAGGRGGAGGQRPGAGRRPGGDGGDQPQRRRRPNPDN